MAQIADRSREIVISSLVEVIQPKAA